MKRAAALTILAGLVLATQTAQAQFANFQLVHTVVSQDGMVQLILDVLPGPTRTTTQTREYIHSGGGIVYVSSSVTPSGNCDRVVQEVYQELDYLVITASECSSGGPDIRVSCIRSEGRQTEQPYRIQDQYVLASCEVDFGAGSRPADIFSSGYRTNGLTAQQPAPPQP